MEACKEEGSEDHQKGVRLDLNKLMKEEHAAYVLITCGPPNNEGRMCVEMTYEGDPTLAAYLVDSAQGFLEEEISH